MGPSRPRLWTGRDGPRGGSRGWAAALLGLALSAGLAHEARAQAAPGSSDALSTAPNSEIGAIPGPGDSTSAPGTGPSPGQPGFLTGLFGAARPNLLGGLYGLRPVLGQHGLSLGLQETVEVFGNPVGGLHQAAGFNGLTTMSLGLDTGKAGWWSGGVFNVSAFQIHGRNYAVDTLPALQTTSGIQAQRSTRLWEAWFQQSLLDGKMDVKIGQQSLDGEFYLSQGSGLFVNTAAGWPLLPSVDQYGGGPAFPLSSLGVRVRVRPVAQVVVLAGVFDDDPAGGRFGEASQLRGAAQSGTRFNIGTGALVYGEAQFQVPAPVSGHSGTYKLGFWYDSGRFNDQRFDTMRVSLADPASSGNPRARRQNYSLYGVIDQIVWRPDPKGGQALNLFARAMGAPGDRNLVDFSANAGVTLTGPFAGRASDVAGLSAGVAKIGAGATRLDRDSARLNGTTAVRGSETFIEATYQIQVAPWMQVQPDAQYVFTPGGGVANPLRPGRRIGNAAVLGVRTNIVF